MSRHRTRIESAHALLAEIVAGNSLQSVIFRKSNVSYNVGIVVLPQMLEYGYIDTLQEPHERVQGVELSYIITDKGRDFCNEVDRFLNKYDWLMHG